MGGCWMEGYDRSHGRDHITGQENKARGEAF